MDTKEVNGWIWPASDQHDRKVVAEQASDLLIYYQHVKKFEVAVQAGSNTGRWPLRLAELFDCVYTFEPREINFRCTNLNINRRGVYPKVYRYHAALGYVRRRVQMDGQKDSAGSYYVRLDKKGTVPTLRIDDLGLWNCNLIYLDIEGMEYQSLKGAMQTIAEYKPVIAIEDKGLSEMYGTDQGQYLELLSPLGYEKVAEVNKDVVYSCLPYAA